MKRNDDILDIHKFSKTAVMKTAIQGMKDRHNKGIEREVENWGIFQNLLLVKVSISNWYVCVGGS